jgi:hypothetical protein
VADSKLNIIINGVDKASGVFGGIRKALGGMATVAGGILAAGAIQQIGQAFVNLGKDSIQAASDLGETANKINVVFGDAAGAVNKFAADAAASLGQSQQQALDAAATFGVFGKAAGLTGGALSNFSTELVGLSSDLSSFYNASPEETIQALGAALRGESEPMRKFGVLLDDVTLRNRALEMGLVSTTKEALTPAHKVMAAYNEILMQTKDAQGDFARTSDGLANTERIVAAQTENLKTQFGQILLPIKLLGMNAISNILLPAGVNLIEKFLKPAVPAVQAFADILTGGGSLQEALTMAGIKLDEAFPGAGQTLIDIGWAVKYLAGEAQNLYNLVVNGDFTGLFGMMEDSAIVTGILDVRDAFLNVGAAVNESLPMIQAHLQGMVDFVTNAFALLFPSLATNTAGALNSLAEIWRTHGAAIMAVVSFAFQIIVATVGGALVLLAGLLNAGLAILQGIMNVFSLIFQGRWEEAFASLQDTLASVSEIMGAAWETFMNLVLSITGSNLTAFNATWKSNFEKAGKIVQWLIDEGKRIFTAGVKQFFQLGFDLIEGLKLGMMNRVNVVLAWLQETFKQIMALAGKIFDIHSPSKAFAKIGANLMLGMAEGIHQNAALPIGAAATAAGGVTNVTNYTLNAYTNQSPRVVQSGFALMRAMSAV